MKRSTEERKKREREPWPTGLLQRCSLLAMCLHHSAIHVGNTLVSVRRGAGPTTAGKISLSMHRNGPAPYTRVWGRKVSDRWCKLAIAMSAGSARDGDSMKDSNIIL